MKSKTKTVFYEQTCSDCDFLKIQGCFPCETRYCTNFPRKRARRFRSKDPAFKAPAWCPKRIDPPALRVYGFLDDFSERMEMESLLHLTEPLPEFTHPFRSHFKVRLEKRIDMKAKDFCLAMMKKQRVECLEDVGLENGEVVEIDSGLASYCFQYLGANTFAQVSIFELPPQKKQPEQSKDGTGGRAQ